MNVQEATAKALLVDRDALRAAQHAGDVLGANAVLMDAYNTDVRPLLRELREEHGPRPGPDRRLPARRATPSRSRAERVGGAAGRLGSLTMTPTDASTNCSRRSNRLGADPRNTNYAGGNTSAKGTATDPVTGEPVELLWVKGSGGDLGTLTEAGPGGAAAGPAARAGRRLPGRRARGRDGRRVRLLPARPGRRGAVDRHRHARPGRRRARRPPAPGLRHRARHRRRRRGADQGVLRRPGGLGAVAAARLPARPGHRRGAAGATRRRSACILGGHGITAWGATSEECEAQLAGDHPDRAGASSTSAAGPSRSARSSPGYEPLPEAERRARAAALAPVLRGLASTDRRRSATSPTATSCSTSWPGTKLPALAALGTSCPDHFLRTKVRPLVLDLPADRAAGRGRRPAAGAARRLPRRTTRAYYERHADAGLARRCAAPTRRSCWCPASACSASARTSRPPGWPASSTSTRST